MTYGFIIYIISDYVDIALHFFLCKFTMQSFLMQKIKSFSILTNLPANLLLRLSLVCCISSLVTYAEDQYPKSIIERKNDAIGSILDNKNFKPKLSKHNHQSKDIINDYKALWQAAMYSLGARSIIFSDYDAGCIVTDWQRGNQQETKVIILIHAGKIMPESFTIKAYSKIAIKNVLKNRHHPIENEDTELQSQISQVILDKAFEITKKSM